MDVPMALHVEKGAIETLPPHDTHLVLQARSLRNTLGMVKRRLLQMRGKEIHTLQDIEHYKYILDHLEERWRDEEGTFAGQLASADAPLAAACKKLWNECYELVKEMEEEVLEMPPTMRDIHARLADANVFLRELAEREHTSGEVQEVVAQLDAIDAARRERGGVFEGDVEAPQPGQAVCADILSHNYELARVCARTAHDEPPELRSVADALRRMRNDLRKLSGQKHHTSADVAHYRFVLMAVASAEAEYAPEWAGSEARKLLEECIATVDALEATAEPMAPEVDAVYRRLQALKKELAAAASRTGKPPEGALKRWMEEANEVDNERAENGGVFGVKGAEGGMEAPAGQVVCRHLLDESYELLQELLQR